MDDRALDALLRDALAPPERPADRRFVLKVERAVAEAELYRRWRRTLLRQFATEGLALAAIGASAVFVAQVPQVRGMIESAPGLAWTALLSFFLLWMLVRGRGSVLA